MNDYELMNQRVDNLRLELHRLSQKEEVLKGLKADVMDELLDTRRQITREDLRRKIRLEGESSPAPCDLDQIHRRNHKNRWNLASIVTSFEESSNDSHL